MSDTADYFSIAVTADSRASRVILGGELDLGACEHLDTVLFAVIAADTTGTILVDLDQLAFIDCAAIGVILDARSTAGTAGKTLWLRHAHGIVHRAFAVLELLPLFDTTDTDTSTG